MIVNDMNAGFYMIMWEWITPCWGPVQTVYSSCFLSFWHFPLTPIYWLMSCRGFLYQKQNTAVYSRCINYFSNPYFSSDDQKDGHPGRNGYYRGSEYTSEQDPSVFVKPNQVNEWHSSRLVMFFRNANRWTHNMLNNTDDNLLAHI